MTKPIARDPIYRRRRFEAEIIELCVRWYIAYRLSYRDDDPAVGNPVRAGVREAMEPMGPRRALILAG